MTLPCSREQAKLLAKGNGKTLKVLFAMKNLLVDSNRQPEKSKQTHAVHYSSLRAATNLNNEAIDAAIADLIKKGVLFDDGIEWHSWEKRDAFNRKWNFVLVKD